MVGHGTYERLSAQDSSFVMFEHRATHMHVGAVAIFERGLLGTEQGGLDLGRITKLIESRLPEIPRYRQKLAFTPLQRHPIWVDDDRFNLSYHVRHTSLPRPGDTWALQRLAGRIFSQRLDREKPLWEMWLVEGVERDRFALISKVHHCMVDGAAGVNLLTLMLRPQPGEALAPLRSWIPRAVPAAPRLLVDEIAHRARFASVVARGLAAALRQPSDAWSGAWDALRTFRLTLEEGLRLPATTPLNRPIGPHRLVGWTRLPLEEIKAVKNRLGGTVNDVVLAVVAGAVRRFLEDRGADTDGLDFRVVIPVNMRTGVADLAEANHVSGVFLSLPVGEPDPAARYARIREETQRVKHSGAANGVDHFMRLADLSGSTLLTWAGVRLASIIHPYNLIVTNVPGPQHPLYLLEARMLELYPQLPLFESQGLGVAVMTYDGGMFVGLVSDWDVVPDLARFEEAFEASFDELRRRSESS